MTIESKKCEALLAGVREALTARHAIGCPARYFLDPCGIRRWEREAYEGSERIKDWQYAYMDAGGSQRRLSAVTAWHRRKTRK